MKKEWNAPAILDLTIQATEHGGSKFDKFGKFGNDSNLCRCENGTSPCEYHHNLNTITETLS